MFIVLSSFIVFEAAHLYLLYIEKIAFLILIRSLAKAIWLIIFCQLYLYALQMSLNLWLASPVLLCCLHDFFFHFEIVGVIINSVLLPLVYFFRPFYPKVTKIMFLKILSFLFFPVLLFI